MIVHKPESFTFNQTMDGNQIVDQANALYKWFESNKIAMCILFLAAGLFTCFMGRKLFTAVLFLAGVFIVVGLVFVIFYSTFLKDESKDWVGWTVLGVSVLFGLILGWLFTKIVKISAFVLAAWGGFTLGLLLYNAFIYKIIGGSTAGFWCWCLGAALICGILALCLFDHVLILATALAGSFLAVAGIGLVAGRYQNPFDVAQQWEKGNHSIDPVFYAYFAANIILCACGAYIQYKHKNGDHHEGKNRNPYHRY